MKKLSALLTLFGTIVIGGIVCCASIIPSQGPGQIGYSSVVLCDSLSLRNAPSFDSSVVQTLTSSDRIIVMNQENGWAHVVLGDSEDSPSGWVKADYIAVDPAWYRTDTETPVYAWNDTSAPKVGLMDAGTTLPILRDDGDWLIVGLRGAAGWINNPDRTATRDIPADTDSAGTVSSNSESAAAEASEVSQSQEQSAWFTVYAEDGSTVAIRAAGGAMYEDEKGRTYVKQEYDAFYYCITTDITYALDPTMWTGEAFGENEFPGEAVDEYGMTGADYGENEFPGEAVDEYGMTGADYGENEFPAED